MTACIAFNVFKFTCTIPVLPGDLKARHATCFALALISAIHIMLLRCDIITVTTGKAMRSACIRKGTTVRVLAAWKHQICKFADIAHCPHVAVSPVLILAPLIAANTTALLMFCAQIDKPHIKMVLPNDCDTFYPTSSTHIRRVTVTEMFFLPLYFPTVRTFKLMCFSQIDSFYVMPDLVLINFNTRRSTGTAGGRIITIRPVGYWFLIAVSAMDTRPLMPVAYIYILTTMIYVFLRNLHPSHITVVTGCRICTVRPMRLRLIAIPTPRAHPLMLRT